MAALLTQGSWVLIADGEKALFLENVADGEDPQLVVVREEEHENPPARDQAENKPGRFNDGPSAHSSKVEDTDWHQLEKDRFASELAELLYKKAHKHKFENLVIVAAPQILGSLRSELHKEVSAKVVSEIPKTLTNHPVHEIERIVVGELDAA
ncbi:Protein required for attachment to host cells [Tranquillimonas rosea]|uniref:Protein required for attachment to host cells n=1 Tax=Tranquillimonas rosea TaxID=641238 RepID=A0A1H9PXW6_9RHOB|nr:host attachment family protein [Tranquillimonas rosea]SER53024.1 Protein required for attachment to host cells [Tranquillimonas rosea]